MKKPTPERLAYFAECLAEYKAANHGLSITEAYGRDWLVWMRQKAHYYAEVETLFGLSMTQTDCLMNEEITPQQLWAEKKAQVNA